MLVKIPFKNICNTIQICFTCRYSVKWSEHEGINRQDHQQYLDNFKDSFYNSMVVKIESAVQKERSLNMDGLYIEVWFIVESACLF